MREAFGDATEIRALARTGFEGASSNPQGPWLQSAEGTGSKGALPPEVAVPETVGARTMQQGRVSRVQGGRGDEVGGPQDWSTDAHVSRWQAGDAVAFQALHNRFAPLLAARVRRSRVWSLLETRCQIDDVVQEIWARVIPSASAAFAPSGRGSFLRFLGKIADRTMIDLARIQRAAKRGDGEQTLRTTWDRHGGPRPGIPAVQTPTSQARCSELEAIARAALSEREFHAWDLVEIQGFPAEEAGLAMRCSGAAIRGLLLRGRAKLVSRVGRDNDPR